MIQNQEVNRITERKQNSYSYYYYHIDATKNTPTLMRTQTHSRRFTPYSRASFFCCVDHKQTAAVHAQPVKKILAAGGGGGVLPWKSTCILTAQASQLNSRYLRACVPAILDLQAACQLVSKATSASSQRSRRSNAIPRVCRQTERENLIGLLRVPLSMAGSKVAGTPST